ncbi:prepilin-type N-terminal cleavage/methylation domain-containing protein [Silvimonas terrae]|uniref:Prepilin-type N-terminal cleavage/methylation domain-containing protein n=1 Tax=Silvimonas terrae TaxID=300266 RepID=A0A840REE4_9NEIS|nr:prepilin-type N-terminal cleavage/methylation domain-containing protein [Silvimonas terrae]MBB5190888.1 prepilin-type N-terminal cleavage/methylation domain-containing protein [Silvimonas terrae]
MVIRQRGFTLIEMMIVIVIISILLLLGVPLTAKWVGSANVNSATISFTQGAAWARSRALRNTAGVGLTAPSAYLILVNGNATSTSGGTVCVQDATTVTALTCSNAVWSGQLPNGTSATFNGAAAQCLAFTPGGTLATVSLGGVVCGQTGIYALSTIQGVSGGPNALN